MRVSGFSFGGSEFGNQVHLFDPATGELLRELNLGPTRDYQPQKNKETPEP